MSRRYSSHNQYRTDPLRGRRLWRYGDWGSAGEYIGRHWEEIGTPILAAALGRVRPPLAPNDPAYRPRLLISLVADAELAEQVHGAGLAHADTILLGYGAGGRVVAEPVDFKWSLETAESRQVSANGLVTLLTAGLSHLDAQMAAALAELVTLGPYPDDAAWGPPILDFGLPILDSDLNAGVPADERQDQEASIQNPAAAEEAAAEEEAAPLVPPRRVDAAGPWGAVRCRDGVFFAPHNQANLHFLQSDWNGRKGEPLSPDQVWFEEVDGPTFFSVLPGWEAAQALAGYDRSTAMLATLDGAERYYRLGAGTQGALSRWHTSIFSEAPASIGVLPELDELRRAQRLWSSTDLSLYLDRMMSVRAEREGALRDWLRELYGWGRFRSDLGRAGVDPRELESKGGKRHWGAVFGQISRGIEARVKADGLALIAAPMSDMAALEELQKRTTDLQSMAGALAAQVIRDELAARRPSSPRPPPD